MGQYRVMSDSSTSCVKEVPLSEDPIQRAINYGIDISLLEANLSKSVEERADQHDAALQLALELRKAGRIRYGR